MNQVNWNEALKSYPENEEMVQLYEDWGDTEYLKEVFAVLNEFNPDWNKEKELGSWGAELVLDLLEELEEELESTCKEERIDRLNEMLDERYEDFRSCHQFSRVNNVAIRVQAGEQQCDDISAYVAEEGEKIGFPILVN